MELPPANDRAIKNEETTRSNRMKLRSIETRLPTVKNNVNARISWQWKNICDTNRTQLLRRYVISVLSQCYVQLYQLYFAFRSFSICFFCFLSYLIRLFPFTKFQKLTYQTSPHFARSLLSRHLSICRESRESSLVLFTLRVTSLMWRKLSAACELGKGILHRIS